MKDLTYQQKIIKVLEDANDWVPSHQLAKVNTEWGWIGTSGDRRARELAEDAERDTPYIWNEVKYWVIRNDRMGKYAHYRLGRVAEIKKPEQIVTRLANGSVAISYKT